MRREIRKREALTREPSRYFHNRDQFCNFIRHTVWVRLFRNVGCLNPVLFLPYSVSSCLGSGQSSQSASMAMLRRDK